MAEEKPAEKAAPEKPAAKKPAPPASPAVVKKTTALKTPREIQLEKELAHTSDRLSGLEGWKAEIDAYLAANRLPAQLPAPAPAPKPQPAAQGSEYDRWLRGEL